MPLYLKKLVAEYNSVQKLIGRLNRHYPTPVLQGLIYQSPISVEMMKNESAVENWVNPFVEQLTAKEQKRINIQCVHNLMRNAKCMKRWITVRKHGIDTDYFLNFDFVHGNEYAKISS